MKKTAKIIGVIVMLAVAGYFGWKSTQPDPSANPIMAEGQNEITVLPFSTLTSVTDLPAGWTHRKFMFVPAMQLSLITDDDPATFRCETDNGGSIFRRSTDISLGEYPTLVWDWRIDTPINNGIDEATEAGDDHPARLFVMLQDSENAPHLFEIIWSNQKYAAGDYKYIGDFAHYVANGLDENSGEWQHQEIDLLEIYRTVFERDDIPTLKSIGIFCDTDNAGGQSDAYFSDVVLRR